MNKNIHPNSSVTTFRDTKGNVLKINSCLGPVGKEYDLAVDIHGHQAWTKATRTIATDGNVGKLNKKFEGFDKF